MTKTLTVAEIITTLKDSNKVDIISPAALGNYLIVLSAFINTAGMNVLEAEQKYCQQWNFIRETVESDKQADQRTKLTAEYLEWKKSVYAEKSLVELIRSIKKILQIKSEEAKNVY